MVDFDKVIFFVGVFVKICEKIMCIYENFNMIKEDFEMLLSRLK